MIAPMRIQENIRDGSGRYETSIPIQELLINEIIIAAENVHTVATIAIDIHPEIVMMILP